MRFNLTVVAGVLIIVGAMAFSTVSMILSVARRSAVESAERQFEIISTTARERTISFLQPAMSFSMVAAFVPGVDAPIPDGGMNHPARLLFTQILRNQPTLYSLYVGRSDGTFFQVINASENTLIVAAHEAPAATDIILRTVTGQGENRVQTWVFLDAAGSPIAGRRYAEVSYDPRMRPWYVAASEYSGAVLSKPYVFNSLKQPGITASHAIAGGSGVVGVDLTISRLTAFVSRQEISPNGGIAVLTDELDVIAESPKIDSIFTTAYESGVEKTKLLLEPGTVVAGDLLIRTEVWSAAVNRKLAIVTAAPLPDFMANAVEMRRRILVIASVILMVTVPFVVFWAHRLAAALKELATDAERVGRMVFDGELTVRTPVYEFHQLARGFEVMKSTIAERTKALNETLAKLEMLVDMGIAMSAEFDLDRLSEMILANAKKLTNADGGSLYLVDEAREKLEFKIVLNETLGFEQGGTSGIPVSMKPVPLYDVDGNENHRNVVTHTFHTEQTENIRDAYEVGEYDFSGTREFDVGNNYRSVSFLTVPLKPRGGGDVLGALQLINAVDPESGEIVPFREEFRGFVEALSSGAAVAVQNGKLMERQKQLFDDLVRFVASAIDAKSPYTARHCARVPEIAKILAEKAQESESGPFARFRFENAEQKREFEVGAWLHDCGKVTTPEYVVDKATKLETIYNRIHEIRTRFEVLLRDARIERHEAVLAGTAPEIADREYERRERKLYDDFAFVAQCNVGSEYMEDDKLDRLMRIASTPWLRHFDNRLGLSRGEMRRCVGSGGGAGAVEPPVRETLIADRPEHVIPRENWTQASYEKFGFRFSVPDCLYNRGELYNLSVRRGTLTVEERFKIDEHVAQTIVMLEHLPFPDDLRRVPEYAGTHHETPCGTGYPRKLTASQLSIPARIMAVADIFEALTSTDRPYKRDQTLSEAIAILHRIKLEGRIDPDVFDLLLVSGAYKEYAEAFLEPSQIDEVDVAKYLSP